MQEQEAENGPSWEALKTAADASYHAGDWKAAASGYKAAMVACDEPDHAAKLASNLAQAFLQLEQWDEGCNAATAATILAPDWEKAWYRLGTAHLGRGAADEAATAFRRGLKLKPNNRQLREGLQKALAAGSGGSTGTSVANGTSENHSQQQQQQQQQQQAPTAAAVAAAAKGKAQPSPSRGSFGGASPPTPESSDPGAAVAEAENSAAAAEAAEAAATPPPLADSARQLAEAQKGLGNDAYKLGRYEEATRCFSAALQLCPDTPVYLGNRAAAYLMGKRYTDAVQDCLRAVQLDPAYVKGYARAAKAEMLMGHWQRAEELYRQGVQLDASLQQELVACQIVERKVTAGQEALAAGDCQRAFVLADAACRGSIPPAEPAVRLKVEALIGSGRHAEAVAEARNMTLGGDPQAPEVLALRSRALYLCGNMPMAQQLFQQALRRDPDCVPAQRGLKRLRAVTGGKERGNAAFSAGRYSEAHEQYSASLAADPDLKTAFMAQVVCNRAAAAAKLGRHDESLSDAELAIELDASYAKAYVRRSQAHQELQNYEAAIRDLEKVAEMEENYPGLGEMLRQARLALKKSKRIDYYAILELDQGADEDQIKKAYRKAALKHHPDKANEEDREAAEKQFKMVGEAFAVLSDPAQRRKYDSGWNLEEIQQGFSNDGGGRGCRGGGGMAFDEDELFAQMFASRMGGNSSRGFPGGGGYGFAGDGGGGGGFRPF
ncbi:DnaJ subfamily C member 7 [Chlorella vulgaris]